MTDRQLETLQSFPDQFYVVWQKIGGKDAEMSEADLHRLAFEKKITRFKRASFEEYLDGEASRAIAFFGKLLYGYQSKWKKQWTTERDEREAREREDAKIIETCFIWSQVMDWMEANDHFHKAVEQFEHAKTIKGIAYWRKREALIRLLTPKEAYAEYEALGLETKGAEFNSCYEPVVVTGFEGALFKRLFTFAQPSTEQQG